MKRIEYPAAIKALVAEYLDINRMLDVAVEPPAARV